MSAVTEIRMLFQSLNEWKAERCLSLDNQREGYLRNIMEELGELAEAVKQGNSEEYIDALCDIVVFSINALDEYSYSATSMTITRNTSRETLYRNLLHEIAKYARDWDTKYLCNIYHVCKILAMQGNYDLFIAMDKTIKEISSRTGHYSASLKKWVKDTSPEAKSKWYKANYGKCTL